MTFVTSDDLTFETLIAEARTPLLAKFSSESCPPCKAMVPILKALAVESEDRLTIASLNASHSPEAWRNHVYEAYGNQVVPSFVLFDKGRRLGMCFGLKSKRELSVWISSLLLEHD